MKRLLAIICVSSLFAMNTSYAEACTSFRVTAKDGSIVIGRSMEGEDIFGGEVVIFPRGHEFATRLPDNKPGMKWKAKYAFVAVSCFGREDGVTDGMNEAGLSVGCLLLPGFAEYQDLTEANSDRAVTHWQLGSWLLCNFATVDEVRAALKDLVIFEDKSKDIPVPIPLHYIIYDAKGGAVVVEYVKGELHIYDNPIGVATNSPPFDWHLTNLRNHVNLTNMNVDSLKLGDYVVTPLGQGSGLVGLPGDYTPPSRFLRATAMVFAALPVESGENAANLAFHILNTVDIPMGAAAEKTESGKIEYGHTIWTTGHDVTNKIFYFRTYENMSIRKIDLNKLDFIASEVKHISMKDQQEFLDVTGTAK